MTQLNHQRAELLLLDNLVREASLANRAAMQDRPVGNEWPAHFRPLTHKPASLKAFAELLTAVSERLDLDDFKQCEPTARVKRATQSFYRVRIHNPVDGGYCGRDWLNEPPDSHARPFPDVRPLLRTLIESA